MEWKDILPYHLNPPNIQLYRRKDIQKLYDEYNQTEEELKKQLFKRTG